MSNKRYSSASCIRQYLKHRDGKLFWKKRPRQHFQTERGFISYPLGRAILYSFASITGIALAVIGSSLLFLRLLVFICS